MPTPGVRRCRLAAGIVLALVFGAACTVARSAPAPAASPSPTAPLASGHQDTLDASLPPGGAQPTGSTDFKVKSVESDPLPSDPKLAAAVRQGSLIFNQTKQNAGQYVGNSLACTNCHLNGGQKTGALPLVGIASQFPAYSARDNRLISLEDRIRSCFARSLAGTAPPYDSPELMAVSAYLAWISAGQPEGVSPPWRGKNVIDPNDRIAIDQLDPAQGGTLYAEKCAGCHGTDGQGQSGPPLWGSGSYSDGAGLGRVYTLAGFIRYAMPLDRPGSLTDEEAQQIAAYLDGHDRPAYPDKENDYAGSEVPVDAVYYPQRYPTNPLKQSN